MFITASVGNYEVLKMLLANPRAIAEINMKNRVSLLSTVIYLYVCYKDVRFVWVYCTCMCMWDFYSVYVLGLWDFYSV